MEQQLFRLLSRRIPVIVGLGFSDTDRGTGQILVGHDRQNARKSLQIRLVMLQNGLQQFLAGIGNVLFIGPDQVFAGLLFCPARFQVGFQGLLAVIRQPQQAFVRPDHSIEVHGPHLIRQRLQAVQDQPLLQEGNIEPAPVVVDQTAVL